MAGKPKYYSTNVISVTGVEITYELYSPIILEIETLKLEKRLDDSLAYLKDAPAEYSTIPFDYPKKAHPPAKAVPVNDTIVRAVSDSPLMCEPSE